MKNINKDRKNNTLKNTSNSMLNKKNGDKRNYNLNFKSLVLEKPKNFYNKKISKSNIVNNMNKVRNNNSLKNTSNSMLNKKNYNKNKVKLTKIRDKKPLTRKYEIILSKLKYFLSYEHEGTIESLTKDGLFNPENILTTKIECMKNEFYYNYLKETPKYIIKLKKGAKKIFSKFTKIAKNIINQKNEDMPVEKVIEKYKDYDENLSLLEKECNIINCIAYLNSVEHTAFSEQDTKILFKNIKTAFNNEFSNYKVEYNENGLKKLTQKLKNMDKAILNSMSDTQRNIFENLENDSCLYITEKDHASFYNALKTAYIHKIYSQNQEGCIKKLNEYFENQTNDNHEDKDRLKEIFDKEIQKMKKNYYGEKYYLGNEEFKILEIIFLCLLAATFDEDVKKEILSNKNEDGVLEVFLNEFNNDERLGRHKNLIDIDYKNMFSKFISEYSPYEDYIIRSLHKKIYENNVDINLNYDVEEHIK